MYGPELVQATAENIKMIKGNMKVVCNRQKSYANHHRKALEFEVKNKVFLKLSPWKGVIKFKRRGKLSPRHIRPYEILTRIGPMAYKLKLSMELSKIHNVFCVSMLRKYFPYFSHILHEQPVEIEEDLTYDGRPLSVLDKNE